MEKQQAARHTDVNTDIYKHEAHIAKHEADISKHEDEISKHEAGIIIAKHETVISKHEAEISKHEARICKHEADISKHEAEITKCEARFCKLEADTTNHEAEISKCEARICKHEADISTHEAVNARSLSVALQRFVSHNKNNKLRTESLSLVTSPAVFSNQPAGDVEFKTTRRFSTSLYGESSGHQFKFGNTDDMFTNAGHNKLIQFKSKPTIVQTPAFTQFNEAGTDSILSSGLSRSDVMRNFEIRGEYCGSGSDSNLVSCFLS